MPHPAFRRLVAPDFNNGIRGDKPKASTFNEIYDALENTPTLDDLGASSGGLSPSGASDDYAAIVAAAATALSAGRPLHFGPGTFRLSDTLEPAEGARWTFDRNATITYTSGGSKNYPLIEIVNDDVELIGPGRLLGTWDNATYIRHATGGVISGQKLLSLNPADDVTHCVIDGLTIEKAGQYGFRGDAQSGITINGLVMRNMRLLQCRWAHYLIIQSGGAIGEVITDNVYVDDTWGPVSQTYPKDSTLGGNAFFFAGSMDRVTCRNLEVKQAGRMALEIWRDAADPVIAKPVVESCYLGPSMYRTLSLGGDDLRVVNTTAVEIDDFTELNGQRVVVDACTFERGGILVPVTEFADTAADRDTVGGRAWSITNCTFTNPGYIGPLSAVGAEGIEFAHNHIRIDEALPVSIQDVVRPLIHVEQSYGVHAHHNHIHISHSVWERQLARWEKNVSCNLTDNTFHLDSRVTSCLPYDSADATEFVPFIIRGLVDCDISRNDLTVATAMSIGYAVAWDWAAVPTSITRRVYTSATAFTDTTITGTAPQNTPPGAPSAAEIYLVGDVPTGAWASNPLSFATWGGASWTYQAIKDFFPDRSALITGPDQPRAPRVSHDGYYPLEPLNGDVYCLVNAGAFYNTIKDNVLDADNKLTVSLARFTLLPSAAGGVSWGNRWERNSFPPNDWNTRIVIDGDAIIDHPGQIPRGIEHTRLQPACLANRGKVRRTVADPGTADAVSVCTKDAANAYGWRTLI